MALTDLTTESLTGTGVFDVLMKAVKLHIIEEYDAQRITGKEYATVYLGALTAILQTSAQYLVNEVQIKLLMAQTGLTEQQTVTELANTSDNIPDNLGFNYNPTVVTPIDPLVDYGSPTTWL